MSGTRHVIFDFETLSQDPVNGVVVSMAMLNFNELRFTSENKYIYGELVSDAKFIKFNVEEQVKDFGRKIEPSTLEWWGKQSKQAQKVLKPSADDRSITELYDFFMEHMTDYPAKIYTRRNTFDPIFMTSLMKATGKPEPYQWWDVRDTISYMEGLAANTSINTTFIPEGLEDHFVAHDPRHDIAMDVMRMQHLNGLVI